MQIHTLDVNHPYQLKCHECRERFAYADVRLTLGRHTVALCDKHVVALIEALLDSSEYVTREVHSMFAEPAPRTVQKVESGGGNVA